MSNRQNAVSNRAAMNIEHSPLINDFLCFYMETRVGGELRYETVVYYYPKKDYFITDKRTGKQSELFPFEDESTVEAEIKSRVERLVNDAPDSSVPIRDVRG
jgi:hypothetical protein